MSEGRSGSGLFELLAAFLSAAELSEFPKRGTLFSSGRYDWSVNFAFCRFWRYSCWNPKRACDRSFAEPSTQSDFLRGKRAISNEQHNFNYG